MKYESAAQHLMNYAETLDANSSERMEFRLAAMFLREHQSVIPDNPDWDFTDDAHPAWWRGHENGCALACQGINEILDGKDDGQGVGVEPWHSTRQRLIGFVQSAQNMARQFT